MSDTVVYSEHACSDGAEILCNGVAMKVEEVVLMLNALTQRINKLRADNDDLEVRFARVSNAYGRLLKETYKTAPEGVDL